LKLKWSSWRGKYYKNVHHLHPSNQNSCFCTGGSQIPMNVVCGHGQDSDSSSLFKVGS
jgi:hypothetical protein